MSSVYIIRNKETLVQWVAKSGKRSWSAPAHAKNAFAYSGEWQAADPLLLPLLEERGHIRRYKGWAGGYHQTYTSLKFKEQDVYEIVELSPDADLQVMVAADLLRQILAQDNYRMDTRLQLKVEGYIGKSTKKEIKYAKKMGKNVKYLEEV